MSTGWMSTRASTTCELQEDPLKNPCEYSPLTRIYKFIWMWKPTLPLYNHSQRRLQFLSRDYQFDSAELKGDTFWSWAQLARYKYEFWWRWMSMLSTYSHLIRGVALASLDHITLFISKLRKVISLLTLHRILRFSLRWKALFLLLCLCSATHTTGFNTPPVELYHSTTHKVLKERNYLCKSIYPTPERCSVLRSFAEKKPVIWCLDFHKEHTKKDEDDFRIGKFWWKLCRRMQAGNKNWAPN